jgi:hypothetical protein
MSDNRVNLFTENQRLQKENENLKDFVQDLVSQMTDRMNVMIGVLNEIKEKQYNVTVNQSVEKGNEFVKTREQERPFIPSIDTSRSRIEASDVQKRNKKIDLKDSVSKLQQINNE